MADDLPPGARRHRLVALACAAAVITALGVPASASAACDTEVVRAQAQETFPEYEVRDVNSTNGIVTLLLARPGGAAHFAVALRTVTPAFYTSVMGAQLDAGESAERARVDGLVASWYANTAVQEALAQCAQEQSLAAGDAAPAVRSAAANALGTVRLGDTSEWRILVAALLLSLAIVLVPGLRRPRGSTPRAPTDWLDLGLVLAMALVALAIALTVAWRLAPETDEVFTLGSRHEALSYLLSWKVGGEPFNPPGVSVLFGLWLRLADGFFWARVLPLLLIPVTALVAYRAGTAAFGRYVGLSFAALVILAPAYLRLAAIARVYALVVFALCAILAAVAGTYTARRRGAAVGVAGLFGLWMSYLLWPLVIAAPWMARLELRDRLRVMGALVLMAAALAPRIGNGFGEAMTRTATFELKGPVDALGYALARTGQVPSTDYSREVYIACLAGGIIVALMLAAVIQMRRSAPRQLRNAALALVLVILPVLALLSGGHGIRERHVITVQVVLALWAGVGLGAMLASPENRTTRMLGWLVAIVLIGLSVRGNGALVARSDDWLKDIDRLRNGADLVMIVPRSAQFSVYAMMTGDSPLAGEPVRWPPVCQTDTEWWCRRAEGVPSVSMDEVTDGVVAAAAAAPRSLWIFDARGEEIYRRIPPRLDACERVFRDPTWTVLQCSGTALR